MRLKTLPAPRLHALFGYGVRHPEKEVVLLLSRGSPLSLICEASSLGKTRLTLRPTQGSSVDSCQVAVEIGRLVQQKRCQHENLSRGLEARNIPR